MKISILFSLLAILVLSACGGSANIPTPDPTEALKTVAGEYTIQLTSEDLQTSGLSGPDAESNLGTWSFKLTEDGNFVAERDGQFVADGNFGFGGTEMNVQVLYVCENCACEGNIGRYSWAADEQQLVLKQIYDNCDSMAFVLTAKPLMRR